MSSKTFLSSPRFSCGLLLAAIAFTPRGWAQEAPAPAATPASTGVAAQRDALVARVNQKFVAGARTEAEFAPELAELNALFTQHAAEKTEEVARVALTLARLYAEFFPQPEKCEALLAQVKTGFPQTPVVTQAVTVIEAKLTQGQLQPGSIFPNFKVNDLEGLPLSPAKFKGKVVLIDFWATWCGPCLQELPNVLAAYQKYHAKGFEIIGISLDRQPEALKAMLIEKGMRWPQYHDGPGAKQKLAERYGIASIPATFLLDREGRIVARDLRGAALEEQLAKLLP